MIYWTSIHLPVLTYDDLLIQFLSPFFHSPSSHSKCLLDVLKNMLSNSCRLYWSRYILLTNACTVLNILDVFNMYACTDTFLSLGRTNAKTIVSLSLNMIGDEFFARFDFFGTIIRSTRIESFPLPLFKKRKGDCFIIATNDNPHILCRLNLIRIS